MSTRSVIAKVGEHEGEFTGRYHHSDGYPTGLGASLWKLLHGHFHGDLDAMLRVLIDEHPAGWSIIVDKDFNLKPGYTSDTVGRSGESFEVYSRRSDYRRPQCYCHGHRHEQPYLFTHEDLKENNAGLEWLYLFDVESNRMYIRDLGHGEEMIVELNEPEPSWEEIECGPAPEFPRCRHYAWHHNLAPRTCNLSTAVWRGRKPLEFHDAIGFIVDGKRYKATGSGGNSNYLRQMTGKNLPPDVWVSSVISGNGKRLEIPVAKITKNGYAPLEGVKWVYPPTFTNPQEIIVEAL